MTSRIADFLARCAADVYPEQRMPGHDRITERMAPLVAARLPAGARVLDVGAGQGPALEWFGNAGFDIRGIMLCTSDLVECQKKNFLVSLTDQNAMPEHWTERYDCVWARHVLEHSPIPYFTLTEFNRVLKPGGVLYVEVPLPGTSCLHETNRNHYSVLTEGMWGSLITRAGFVVEEFRRFAIETPVGPDAYVSFICSKL